MYEKNVNLIGKIKIILFYHSLNHLFKSEG
jgi:hypothetical protein